MNPEQAIWADGLIFLVVMIPIVVADVKYQKIPDRYTLTGFVLILFRRLLFDRPVDLRYLLYALLGFTFIWLFRHLSRKKIGLGDAKLSGLIALLLGIPGWIISLLFASLTGIAYGLTGSALGRFRTSERIPFAPFLALGTVTGFTFNLLFGMMDYGLS